MENLLFFTFHLLLSAIPWNAVHGANKIVLPVKNLRNVQYAVLISLGSRQQQFSVLLDTGSCDLWVADRNSPTGNNFDWRSSTTFRKLGQPFDMTYGDGANIAGVTAEDIVTIGTNPQVQVKQTFGLASSMRDNHHSRTDGIIGLNFKEASMLPNKPNPVVYNLMNQGYIPQIGLFLNSNQDKRDGEIVFGGINEDLVEGEFTFAAVPPGKLEDNWIIPLDGIAVNGKMIPGTKITTLVDSGASSIVGPAHIINQINQMIWPRNMNDWRKNYFSCKDLDLRKFPDVTFYINNTPFTLPATAYISQFKMEELLNPGQVVPQLNQYKMTEAEGKPRFDMCQYGFDAIGEHFILGQNFLREYYTQFNYDKRIIGFAKALRGARTQPKPTVTRPPGGPESSSVADSSAPLGGLFGSNFGSDIGSSAGNNLPSESSSVPDSSIPLGGLFGSSYESDAGSGDGNKLPRNSQTIFQVPIGSGSFNLENAFSSVSKPPASKPNPGMTTPQLSFVSQQPTTSSPPVDVSGREKDMLQPSFRLPFDSSYRKPYGIPLSNSEIQVSDSDGSKVKPSSEPFFTSTLGSTQTGSSREQGKETRMPSFKPLFRLPIDSSTGKSSRISQSGSNPPGLGSSTILSTVGTSNVKSDSPTSGLLSFHPWGSSRVPSSGSFNSPASTKPVGIPTLSQFDKQSSVESKESGEVPFTFSKRRPGIPNSSGYDRFPIRKKQPINQETPLLSTEGSSFFRSPNPQPQFPNQLVNRNTGKEYSKEEMASWFDNLPSSRSSFSTVSGNVAPPVKYPASGLQRNNYYSSPSSSRPASSPYSSGSAGSFGGLTNRRFNTDSYSYPSSVSSPIKPSLTDLYKARTQGQAPARSYEPVQSQTSDTEVPAYVQQNIESAIRSSPPPSSSSWSPKFNFRAASPPMETPPPSQTPEEKPSIFRPFKMWGWRY